MDTLMNMQKEQPTVDGYSGLNIDASETLKIQSGNCNTKMTMYEAARWLALVRGVEVIDKKARQLGIDLEKEKSWIKPLALQKYVDEETTPTSKIRAEYTPTRNHLVGI